jgi:hypothetical protein
MVSGRLVNTLIDLLAWSFLFDWPACEHEKSKEYKNRAYTNVERDFSPDTLPNPLLLHILYSFRPIERINLIEQRLTQSQTKYLHSKAFDLVKFSDLQKPLFEMLALNDRTRSPRAARCIHL